MDAVHGQITLHEQLSKYDPLIFQVITALLWLTMRLWECPERESIDPQPRRPSTPDATGDGVSFGLRMQRNGEQMTRGGQMGAPEGRQR
jgi:hypothetical protein